jgi:hypothetical protein
LVNNFKFGLLKAKTLQLPEAVGCRLLELDVVTSSGNLTFSWQNGNGRGQLVK